MKRVHLCLLLWAVVACKNVIAQNEDELAIPLESDNQFPPDDHSESDGAVIEGSGEGVVEDPNVETTTEFNQPPELEEVEAAVAPHNEVVTGTDNEDSCPQSCVCRIEGDPSEFVVDCSGYGLTEFPSPIDSKTTKLILQNNKITEIPKEVALLKKLKELNANDNSIMELALGSISELPELVVLKLANNRLIEYPRDLKNSLSLTKLEELDLGGNDMRTTLSPEVFTGFSALRKLILPTSTPELVQDLCGQFKEGLESVCTGSCDKEIFDCPDAPQDIEEDLLYPTLPGLISLDTVVEEKENADPEINIPINVTTEEQAAAEVTTNTAELLTTVTSPSEKVASVDEFSIRAAVNNAPVDVAPSNTLVSISTEGTSHNESDVKIGAKTSDTKSGGIDRSVIAIIVAGMVVIVAGITIKKNWTSIKKRFSSTPRSPSDRPEGNTNGTTPEEVPLQDKSPV